jgi:hypothetical protein
VFDAFFGQGEGQNHVIALLRGCKIGDGHGHWRLSLGGLTGRATANQETKGKNGN